MQDNSPTPEEIIARFSGIARTSAADIFDIVEGHPRINWQRALDNGAITSVRKIKFNEQGMPEIEFYNAKEALETLAKVMGMLVDRSLIQVDATVQHQVAQVRDNMASLMQDPDKLSQALELAKHLVSKGFQQKQLPTPIEIQAREA